MSQPYCTQVFLLFLHNLIRMQLSPSNGFIASFRQSVSKVFLLLIQPLRGCDGCYKLTKIVAI